MFCHINFQFFSAFFISEAQTQGFRPFAPQKGLPFLSHSLTLSRMLAKIKMKTFLLSLKMPHLFVLAQCLICFVIFVFAGKKQIPSFEINKKRCQGMPHDLFKIMLLLPENGSFRTKIVIYIYIYIYLKEIPFCEHYTMCLVELSCFCLSQVYLICFVTGSFVL